MYKFPGRVWENLSTNETTETQDEETRPRLESEEFDEVAPEEEEPTEQTAKNPLGENKKYVLTNLHEQSSKKQKICLLATVLLVLTVMCVGIGVPLSYYIGKSWSSEYDLVVKNSSVWY